MRIFSYRNKRALRRALLIAGGILLLLLALCISRFVYLQRYITDTDDGAKLDYSQKLQPTGEQPETLDPAQYPYEIIVDTTEPGTVSDAPQQFSGYYITTNMLAKDVDAVRTALDGLDGLTTVMIDVKSVFGYYYYSSEQTGAQTAKTAAESAQEAAESASRAAEEEAASKAAQEKAESEAAVATENEIAPVTDKA